MSFEKAITIHEAIENIDKKIYFLPAIQREFVWKTSQIEKLFDSLMRDYPISSFLFWEIKKIISIIINFMSLSVNTMKEQVARMELCGMRE